MATVNPPGSRPGAARPSLIPVPHVFRGSERKTPDRPCLNCGDPTVGYYCPHCGQRKVEVGVSLRRMLLEALDDQFSINSALPRTLGALLVRPGRLTREYMDGRIVRYIPPFRLYLVSSLVFFLVLSFVPELRDPMQLAIGGDESGSLTIGMVTDSLRAGIEETRAQGGDPDAARIREEALAAAQRAREARRPTAFPARGAVADSVPGVEPPAPPLPPTLPGAGWMGNPRVNTGNAQLDSTLTARLQELNAIPPRMAIRRLMSDYLEHVPQMMFVLLPVFAGILKLLYVRRKRFYVEHFVFSLHLFSFAFLSYTLMLTVRHPAVVTTLSLWLVLYVYLAMKHVYQQGWIATAAKYAVLSMAYTMLMATSAALLLVVTLLMM